MKFFIPSKSASEARDDAAHIAAALDDGRRYKTSVWLRLLDRTTLHGAARLILKFAAPLKPEPARPKVLDPDRIWRD